MPQILSRAISGGGGAIGGRNAGGGYTGGGNIDGRYIRTGGGGFAVRDTGGYSLDGILGTGSNGGNTGGGTDWNNAPEAGGGTSTPAANDTPVSGGDAVSNSNASVFKNGWFWVDAAAIVGGLVLAGLVTIWAIKRL